MAELAKESGVYSEEKVQEVKGIVYDLINADPKTFSYFKYNIEEGSPLRHTHLVGICLKRLKEEGLIAERGIRLPSGEFDREFYATEGMLEKIRAENIDKNFIEYFESLYTRQFDGKSSEGVSVTYPPGNFSSYLAYCTLKRKEKTGEMKSGWEIYYQDIPVEGKLKAKRSTVSGDVTLKFEVVNSRGDNWFDKVSLDADFMKAAKEEMRIIDKKQRIYVRKVFNSIIKEVGFRTQITELYADRIIIASGKEDGVVNPEKIGEILAEIRALKPDKHSVINGPMIRDFYIPRASDKKSGKEKHNELVEYLERRIKEKVERLLKPMPEKPRVY